MEKQVYITDEERAKCQKVADAFAEDETFTDSKALFDALWKDWYDTTLYLTAKEMKLDDILYEEVFNCLSKEKQSAIIGGKADFAQNTGITL